MASDPKEEDSERPRTFNYTWNTGKFKPGESGFAVVSSCYITKPELGFLKIAGSGTYSIVTSKGTNVGNVFEEVTPRTPRARFSEIRQIRNINGHAIAVGLGGTILRFKSTGKWDGIDHGLPNHFDIEGVDGSSDKRMFAVGSRGQIFEFDKGTWWEHETPTTKHLTSVVFCNQDLVYAAGHDGTIVKGNARNWELLNFDGFTNDIWGLEYFNGILFVSTLDGVFTLNADDELAQVDFGRCVPATTYKLSAAPGVLWSYGETDVVALIDGTWKRAV